MNEIVVDNLTKDYGHGRGIYDVSFQVENGEVFGFLGPNGAGKSTTMRHLMGFSKPQKGNAVINGLPCWSQHAKVMKSVGYLPGEVALPEGLTGKGFLNMMRGMKSSLIDRTDELVKTFEVNVNAPVKSMSIGEKRKLAVVAAFMGDPQVLLLDEPTSGLDPVMQEIFIDFVKGEKANNKTILLSSHIFSEVEALCDRIAIIKDGRIVSVVNATDVKHFKRKSFEVIFEERESVNRFTQEGFEVRELDEDNNRLSIICENPDSDKLIKTFNNYRIRSVMEDSQTLEDYFMHFYKNDKSFGGIDDGKHDKSK